MPSTGHSLYCCGLVKCTDGPGAAHGMWFATKGNFLHLEPVTNKQSN